MNLNPSLLAVCLALVTGACSAPSGERGTNGTAPADRTAAPAPSSVKHGATRGTIEAIDVAARTITIRHVAVPELEWPAMTMAFHAPDIDLSAWKPGDRIAFEFSVSSMTATITTIRRE
jgi:Cu(I)/Ag(I) efflux system protein CusF